MATAQSPLSRIGYNLVTLPKTDIKPLALLYETDEGVSPVEAELSELFKNPDMVLPPVKPNIDTASIQGAAELDFDAKASVSMLDWLLEKLNLGKMSGKVSVNENYTVTATYADVQEDKISLLDLDNFIKTSTPIVAKFSTFRQKLEHSELYVINAVLKSKTISVTIQGKNGLDIEADAKVKGILDANASIARKANNAITVAYKNDTPVIFAFKAQRIIYEKESFCRDEPAGFYIKNQIGKVLLGPEDFPAIPLHTNGELIEL